MATTEGEMLVAVPEFRGRVSPTFDFCHRIALWKLDDRGIHCAGHRQCGDLGPGERASRLQALGIEVLLCGAIGKEIEEDIRSRGIEVVFGLTGGVAEVVAAYRCQALNEPRFRLPGVQAN